MKANSNRVCSPYGSRTASCWMWTDIKTNYARTGKNRFVIIRNVWVQFIPEVSMASCLTVSNQTHQERQMSRQFLRFVSPPEADCSFALEVNPGLCWHSVDQNSQQRSDLKLGSDQGFTGLFVYRRSSFVPLHRCCLDRLAKWPFYPAASFALFFINNYFGLIKGIFKGSCCNIFAG